MTMLKYSSAWICRTARWRDARAMRLVARRRQMSPLLPLLLQLATACASSVSPHASISTGAHLHAQARGMDTLRAVSSSREGQQRRAFKRAALLRGGEADEEESTPSRIRLTIAAAEADDPSAIEVDAKTMDKLGLVEGDTVLLRAKKMRKTVCAVVEAKGKLLRGEARLSSTAKANLRLASGDTFLMSPLREVPEASMIMLTAIASSLEGFEGDAFEDSLAPFLKDAMRPLTVGDVIETPVGDGERLIKWKVVEMEPEMHCLAGADAQIFPDGEPISDDEAFEEDDAVGYDDIGGLDKQLAILKELVDLPLKQPEVFKTLGVRPPRGVLLHGPPGSGKTMIANAVKTETGVYFKQVNGPEVMSKRSGEAEGSLRQVFEDAEKNSPAIIFIDEIDAIAPKRDKTQGEMERRIISQLLTLLDGMNPASQVLVLAATSRANVLEPALRRFGRFDREIALTTPDVAGRLEILRKKTQKLRLAADVDLNALADDSHGYCGADLSQLVTEAAMQCVREKAGDIDIDAEDIDDATLESMVVTQAHLTYAMSKTHPSSLRDKAVEIPDCSWKDVGGLFDVKREMTETLQYPLKFAAKYQRYGMQPSKGILLYGPSGCGKTLVAKAIANEVKSNFISVKGPELLSMWFGESESNVRELFNKARGAAPCILFFDEIDSIAKPRGSGQSGGGEAGDRIVNQILTEIDGVGAKKSVFIIAATNRPDMLDSAVMRPGRIDQLVYLPLPDRESRVAIFKANTRKSPLADDVDLYDLADRTDGFSGADITEVCQRACKLAIRQNIDESSKGSATVCSEIDKSHFDAALSTARKSVSQADIKKFMRFQASMRAGK